MNTAVERDEFRNGVWSGSSMHFARYGEALNLTDIQSIKIKRKGLIVYSDVRDHYCDGRSHPQAICCVIETRRLIVFLPWTDSGWTASEIPPVNTKTYAVL